MNNNTFELIKKFLVIVFILVLILFIVVLLIFMPNKKTINEINQFIKTNTKVLYITNEDNYSQYPIELLKKYEVEYMYFDSSKLVNYEKTEIKKIINTNNLDNVVSIFKDGKLVDSLINYDKIQELDKFFQKYEVIPEIIGDVSDIVTNVEKLISTDLTILYLPYKYTEEVRNQDVILKNIAFENNINYQMINAYLLSKNQQEKLNSFLKISSVDDQIIILIREQKIIGSIRGINKKSEYVDKLKEYSLISQNQNYMTQIDYSNFEQLIKNDNKTIVVVTKDDCRYCDDVFDVLNKIIINYDVDIKYIDIKSLDSEVSKKVEEKLIGLQFLDGFTTPMTFIFESNKIVDYIIGASTEQYFIDIFLENGIIK